MADNLVVLYKKIADMTAPICSSGSCEKFRGLKNHCCSREYCEVTRKFARERYGVRLAETGNDDLPFMGERGCVVAPHLRPVCSIHICDWTWASKSTAPKGYVELRQEIFKQAKEENKWPLI
jgi:hypothetical protein